MTQWASDNLLHTHCNIYPTLLKREWITGVYLWILLILNSNCERLLISFFKKALMSQAYSKPSQKPKKKLFEKIINNIKSIKSNV